MNEQADVSLELVSDPKYLCALREMTALTSRALGFTDSQSSQIALAVDEAVANVIKHGYLGRADGRIWVRFFPLPPDALGKGLRIVIDDEARQVDPTQIKGRDLSDIRPGGLGVHIIREIMDSATYERRTPTGMRLTLSKRVGSPPKSQTTLGVEGCTNA